MQFTKVKTVFFDVGDTLYKNEALEKAYPRELHSLLAATRNIEFETAKSLLKEITEQLKKKEKHVTKVRAMKELGISRSEVHNAFGKVDPAAYLEKDSRLFTLLEKLAAKRTLGIISNFRRSHTIAILEALGIPQQFFPLMITEDIVTKIKPDLEPFLKAVDLSGYPADATVYIGDSPTKDMRPAKKSGMMTILLKENPEQDDLVYADACIPDIFSVTKVLE